MPSLVEIQRGLAAATISGDVAALAGLGVVAGTMSAAARIDIYRNNVLGNYRKALAATFPVVRRLVGAAFFNATVDAYVRAHPSTRGDVNRYGSDLARFLAAYEPARTLAYLPDVARLEWAIDQSAIAADAPPFDLAALAALPEDAHACLRFVLHPSVQLVESHYPILHIWRVNQADYEGSAKVDLDEGGDSLLVARGERGVDVERLKPGMAALLHSFAAGERLAIAAGLAAGAEPSFDLPAALRRHVANHVLVAFVAPTSCPEECCPRRWRLRWAPRPSSRCPCFSRSDWERASPRACCSCSTSLPSCPTPTCLTLRSRITFSGDGCCWFCLSTARAAFPSIAGCNPGWPAPPGADSRLRATPA
jgi:hypothetical protein